MPASQPGGPSGTHRNTSPATATCTPVVFLCTPTPYMSRLSTGTMSAFPRPTSRNCLGTRNSARS
ncbi:hypothetical protein B0T26DRAFT_682707 [Lasiosphaeria miniovina]|uniref:Uncharacterized protein n=1 Tax=Lasiosphaeria miniovina TaxID=1954250 RepID=A0AA40ED55_9PEZI|nr:uncharacterized protein B0T26DRAFT_682707 [Lasiosphaeria miniovina]KAK0733056.1 hypothetical protein B0T26DRAFT_682707 [Lasiosphaeria miniovina]